MIIKKVFIQNYKSLRTFELNFTDACNIIVGNNEAGKSTLLEAINLALTGQLNGRSISYELSPFLFNKDAVSDYINALKAKENPEPPKITIEVYFKESPELSPLCGTNNTKRENTSGISLTIQFNEEYAPEYTTYISDPDKIKTVPTEYFEVKWYSFDFSAITTRSLPIKTTIIDTSSVRMHNGTDYYIHKTIDDILEKKERAGLSLLYRNLKEDFAAEETIQSLNKRLKENKNILSHRELSISLDISHKTNWDANLTSYLDDIPFKYIGKGDQNVLKMVLALERKKSKESDIILIEEPENHLSFSTMNMLIDMINERCGDKQVIITTHSALVLNKLGIEKLILLGETQIPLVLSGLPNDTKKYFKKLPGYDTLRMVLAKKTILVEGPSDELLVQIAYKKRHGKLPIEHRIDVISVGLSFTRFLDIARILKSNVVVVTDNDGFPERVRAKYSDYISPNIKVCFDETDADCHTLEPQIVKCNDLSILNLLFAKDYTDASDMISYMLENKTDCALKIFETELPITIPQYIQDAVE